MEVQISVCTFRIFGMNEVAHSSRYPYCSHGGRAWQNVTYLMKNSSSQQLHEQKKNKNLLVKHGYYHITEMKADVIP